MVHLKPLPGSYLYEDNLDDVIDFAIKEAKKLEEANFDAVLIENFNDKPFKKEIDKITLASFTVIAKAIKEEVGMKIGINVLRNDSIASYSIAYAIKADFIRVNVLNGVAITDQGIIEGNAHELFRLKKLVPSKIKIYADVHVKHSYQFIDFETSLLDTYERALADAIIISGRRTGEEVNIEDVKLAKKYNIPTIIGSGVNEENIKKFINLADGFIIGSYIKRNGNVNNEIDINRAKRIAELFKSLRGR